MRPRLGVDIGGTFTDFVLEIDGQRHTHKRLSTPDAPERAVLEGVQHLLRATALAPGMLGSVLHGTTLATNAVIERRGARTALLTTAGFRDVLETGFEARADQYDLLVRKPEPLVPRDLRLSVAERLSAQGQVLMPLDLNSLDAVIDALAERNVQSVAIGFLHSYVNPAHEQAAAERIAQRLPGIAISLSSAVSPEIREFERFSTTCVNAYVQPLMMSYLRRLADALAAIGITAPMLLMTSDGGLCDLDTACAFPVRLLESGPAGGALLAAHISDTLGLSRVLSLDIGGTTAKLCFIDDGEPQMSRSLEVARLYRFKPGSGIPLRIPVVELCEIGAGGGSIASVDALGCVQVGPRSAGAQPGPACYGLGGSEATLTDAHLVAGRLDPDYFAAGTLALDTDDARRALSSSVGNALNIDTDDAAYAVAEIADEAMASAAREHAIELGKSIAGRTLIAFGGSAPLHAARLATKLGIDRVVIPAAAGVGSAYGFLVAPVAFEVTRSLYQPLASLDISVAALLDALRTEAMEIVARVAPQAECHVNAAAYMRYRGQGYELKVPLPEIGTDADMAAVLRERFEACYRTLFGRLIDGAPIEILSWSVRVHAAASVPAHGTAGKPRNTQATRPARGADLPAPFSCRTLLDQGTRERINAAFYRRAILPTEASIAGPAVVVDEETTIVVPPDFKAHIIDGGHLLLERIAAASSSEAGTDTLRHD